MKRMLLAGLLVLAAAIPATVGAAPSREQTNGTGASPDYGRIHVNVKEDGDGVKGHFFIDIAELAPVHLTPSCLTVNGNVAVVGGTIRQGDGAGMMWVLAEITDNGEPGKDTDQHRWRFATQDEVAGPDCEYGDNNPPPSTITQGNYQVFGG
jgi:hypothetical protein